MAESKTNQILITLAEIKKDTGEIFRRLDKINGSIADYSITKKRIDDLEENYNKLEDCIEETSKLLTGIKIKVWGMAGLVSAIMGFVGVIVGKFI